MNEPFEVAPVVGQDRVWVCFETGWPCAAHVPNDPARPYAYPVHEYVRADLLARVEAERDAERARVAELRALCERLCEAQSHAREFADPFVEQAIVNLCAALTRTQEGT